MPVVLYRRQKQILDFLSQYIQKNGFSPTLQQIANALGVKSLATVHEHLAAMTKKGIIRKYDGMIRGLELVDKKLSQMTSSVELPILGFIAAGSPIEPYTDPNATCIVPSTLVHAKKPSFVLQVKGESMIEDGILDGDFVIVEQQEEARNGDIVVALLENGLATLKRYFKEASRIRLEPANAKMSPIFVTKVRIQGKVVGVIRNY
ncbi:MAG: transcriptional repressor LexA [bacterium]|nr:transcriptional repressor LexA [bacterium]